MASRDRPGWAIAAACGAIAIWSLNAAAGGAALAELTVLQVLALQFGGAFAALAAFRLPLRSASPAWRRVLRPRTIAIGVGGLTGTTVLQYLAFATAPLVAANAIAYTWPLLVAAWMALHPGARGSRNSLALAVAGLAGVVLVFAARGDAGSPGSAPLLGYVAALVSAVAMAGYTLSAQRSDVPTGDLLLAGTGAGALVTIPAALIENASWSPAWALALGAGIGVAMIAVGYALWTRAMAHPTGARLAPAAYAAPLLSTGVLLAAGQRLSPLGLFGCALIVLCAPRVIVDAVPRANLNRRWSSPFRPRPRPGSTGKPVPASRSSSSTASTTAGGSRGARPLSRRGRPGPSSTSSCST